jgi:hypothetical protein
MEHAERTPPPVASAHAPELLAQRLVTLVRGVTHTDQGGLRVLERSNLLP